MYYIINNFNQIQSNFKIKLSVFFLEEKFNFQLFTNRYEYFSGILQITSIWFF